MRALVAVVVLFVRAWVRSPAGRGAAAPGMDRRASGLALRVVALLALAQLAYRSGAAVAASAEAEAGAAVLVITLLAFQVSQAVLLQVPVARGLVAPLSAPLLDVLPVPVTAHVVLGLFQGVMAHVVTVAALAGLGARAPLTGAAVGLALSSAGLLIGFALVRLLRVWLAPLAVSRAVTVAMGVQGFALFGSMQARPLASLLPGAPAVRAIGGRVAPLVEGGVAPVLAFALAAGGAASMAIAVAERLGYDRLDALPTRSLAPARASDLTLARIDRVLAAREPGAFAPTLFTAYILALNAGLVALSRFAGDSLDEAFVGSLVRAALVITVFMTMSFTLGRAGRMIARDAAARTLLAPLPIAPRDTLDGKGRALRTRALIAAAPVLLVGFVQGPLRTQLEGFARAGLLLAAIGVAAEGAASVAFLTSGLGAPRASATLRLEALLLMAPLFAIATTAELPGAVVPFVALLLVTRTARRSAHEAVRWRDDDEPFERATPVWRALLVFAAFAAVQGLASQLLTLARVPADLVVPFAYGASGLALVLMTFAGRRGSAPMRVVPPSPALAPLGALLGAASGLLAVGYGRLLARVDVAGGDASAALPFALVVVILAPLAEEIFFRGWLEEAILDGGGSRARGVLLAAFAFAAVHPPLAFPAVFTLGLVASTLYARSRALLPGILAHAAHNLVVVLAAVRS